ncbi:MAG: hypothetical protein Q7S96_02140 [bacterium]|nr:hypothetical protein [bacterium]
MEQDGVPVTIAGLPAHGPEFTIGTETLEACESEATEEPTCSVGAATLSDSCIREVTARQHQAYYEQRIGCTHEGPYAGYCGRSSIFSIEYFGNCAPRLVESFALRLWKYEGSDAIEVDVRDVFHGDAMASLDLGLVGDAYRSAALIVEPDEDAVGSGESFTVSHIEGFPIPASGTASMDVSVQRRYDAEPGRYQFMLEQLTTTALDGTAPHVFEVFWGGQFVIVGPPEAESCRVEETILPSGPNNLVFTTPAFSEQLFSFELLGTCEEDLLLDTVTVQLVRQEGNGFVAASICETFACDCEREDCGGGPFGIMDANTGYWLGMDDVGLTLDGSQWFGTPFDRTTYPAPRTRLRIPATGSLKFALAGAPLASAIPGTYRFIIAGAKAMSTDFERYHQYNPTLGPAITIGE